MGLDKQYLSDNRGLSIPRPICTARCSFLLYYAIIIASVRNRVCANVYGNLLLFQLSIFRHIGGALDGWMVRKPVIT